MGNEAAPVVAVLFATIVLFLLFYCRYSKKRISAFDSAPSGDAYEGLSNFFISRMTVEKFLSMVFRNKKPLRFTKTQIAGFTTSYSTQLGAGRFSRVFKGALPNGLPVAVKVFNRDVGIDQEQFMAAVRTIWRTHHVNLVRLFGFCLDDAVRALVYEYVDHGSLEASLLDAGVPALFDIAVGVARGIRHLHDESKEKKKVVHYDIKLRNVLLDGTELIPKVSNAGLAPLVNPAATQVILSTFPAATRGCVAPEIREQPDITEKCDVYGFGMLLLEIVGRKRIPDEAAAPDDGEQWFPEKAWSKYESGDLMELIIVPRHDDHTALVVDDDDDVQQWKELVERMCKVAFWCLQQQPEARPSMGNVVKILEGEMDIAPPGNPFQEVPGAPVMTYIRTKVTSSGHTITKDDASDDGDVTDFVANIIQTVIQLDGS